MTQSASLDRLWWLWVPLAAAAIQAVMEIFIPGSELSLMHSEWGPHETLQFVVIALAFMTAIGNLLRVEWNTQKLVGAWMVLAALGAFYVAGEEISWGQHVFRWITPQNWQALNDQGETNLHNTSSWLDQKPRLILFVGIVIGGIIIPALRRFQPSALPPKFAALYPSNQMFLMGLMVLIPYLVEGIGDALGVETFARESEVQELYMYYFILLYLWDLRGRELSKA